MQIIYSLFINNINYFLKYKVLGESFKKIKLI
jgi:hypothetical protein